MGVVWETVFIFLCEIFVFVGCNISILIITMSITYTANDKESVQPILHVTRNMDSLEIRCERVSWSCPSYTCTLQILLLKDIHCVFAVWKSCFAWHWLALWITKYPHVPHLPVQVGEETNESGLFSASAY